MQTGRVMTRRDVPSAAGLLGVSVLAAGATLLTTVPAAADTFDDAGDTPVVITPDCRGVTSTEVAVAPLQEADRVENGVRVTIRFSSDNHDGSCTLTATATWLNLDTGAAGSEDITVASTADPASGGHYGSAGYNRAQFWTGPGTVVVTVSTHPGTEFEVTV